MEEQNTDFVKEREDGGQRKKDREGKNGRGTESQTEKLGQRTRIYRGGERDNW